MRRGLAVLVLAGAVATYTAVATRLETQRLAVPLARAAAGSAVAARLQHAAMLEDLRTLASVPFAGRRTGTEGSRKAQALIEARFRALGLRPYGASYTHPFSFTQYSVKGLLSASRPFKTEYPRATNLVGYLPGTRDPEHALVISAHYDHLGQRADGLYPGADDNASGVAAMLALAAWFQQHPPARTLVFAAFDAEELGLRGAKAFVGALPLPRERVVANLNLDMVSHNDRNRLFVAGTAQSPALRPVVEAAARRHTLDVFLGHDRPAYLAGLVEDWTDMSDHGAFHAQGIPFLYFGVEDHADYHAPTDTFERINPAFFGEAAELVLEVALALDQGTSS